MSADSSEKKLFGEIVRNQTKYGSTTHPMPKFTKYVKHVVSRVDTLQGIALKYGATVIQMFDSCTATDSYHKILDMLIRTNSEFSIATRYRLLNYGPLLSSKSSMNEVIRLLFCGK